MKRRLYAPGKSGPVQWTCNIGTASWADSYSIVVKARTATEATELAKQQIRPHHTVERVFRRFP